MSGTWRTKIFSGIVSFTVAILLFASSAKAESAGSDPAVRQVEAFYATLLETMKQGHQLGIAGRYKKLQPAIEAAFDLQVMTKLVVGPPWVTISSTDQKQLVEAFERMTVASYAKNFNSFGGQKFVVDPNVENRNLDRIVKSELDTSDKDPVSLIYRMRESGGTWKIIDVYLAGTISELALRRSEFSATVKTGGASGLVKKLNEVSDKLMAAT